MSLWKKPVEKVVLNVATGLAKSRRSVVPVAGIDESKVEGDRFVAAFCGTGTGHFTQTLAVIKILQKAGMTLAAVITDDAASKKMLDETIQNLGVEVLILPTVNFVDPVRGTSPLRDGPRLLRKIAKWDTAINAKADALTALFVGARAGLLLNFFLFPLARWMQFSPLPPCVRTLHIAPQFCLAGLPLSKLGSVDEVIHKAFIEVMRRVFAASAPCHGISARPDAAGLGTVDPPLAPIIELPEEFAPADGKAQAPLLLCYFLVQKDARRLERLIAKNGLPGVEVHCFTAEALPEPKGRPLALHSHPKQRALFQELFSRCTGVICSSGNETIWEAVSRGVPVLTIPSPGNGEQMLNAVSHAANHPLLVRGCRKLRMRDVRWIAGFEHSEASRQESRTLRTRVAALESTGSEGLAQLVRGAGTREAEGSKAE